MRSVIGRPCDAALVEADPAVVHSSEQVIRLGRIENDLFLGLESERAILVDADIAPHAAVPLATPDRAFSRTEIRGSDTGGGHGRSRYIPGLTCRVDSQRIFGCDDRSRGEERCFPGGIAGPVRDGDRSCGQGAGGCVLNPAIPGRLAETASAAQPAQRN
jgi:hypothetical protein